MKPFYNKYTSTPLVYNNMSYHMTYRVAFLLEISNSVVELFTNSRAGRAREHDLCSFAY